MVNAQKAEKHVGAMGMAREGEIIQLHCSRFFFQQKIEVMPLTMTVSEIPQNIVSGEFIIP